MNASELHPDDAALLERLGDIAAVVDPVPEDVVEAGKVAFRLYRPDVDVMALVSESNLAAVRAASPTSHMHFFELGSVSMDVEVTLRDGFCSIVGVVADSAGAHQYAVTLETASATFSTTPDDGGRFDLVRVPEALMRITIEDETGGRLTTPWFEPA
jgi:hypothetical protein